MFINLDLIDVHGFIIKEKNQGNLYLILEVDYISRKAKIVVL